MKLDKKDIPIVASSALVLLGAACFVAVAFMLDKHLGLGILGLVLVGLGFLVRMSTEG